MSQNSAPTVSSPFIHQAPAVAVVMRQVLWALIPGAALATWWFGVGVPVQIALAIAIGYACEAAMLKLRGQPLRLYLADGSVGVTAVLFALAMPPAAPWWMGALGMVFAVLLAKHAFGGLGHNLFNPAMAGYAFLLVCFPAEMKVWAVAPNAPGLAETLSYVFAGAAPPDAYSGATALEFLRAQLRGMKMISELQGAGVFGHFGGRGFEWVGLGYLAGGLWLLRLGLIRWQIPVGMLGALAVLALLFHLYDADVHASPLFHLLSGAAMIGAFFIATDPVTSPTTPRGRLLFGIGVGVLLYVIRGFGNYPDGVAFAVLIMNAASPLIERLTPPRLLGARR